MFVRHSLVYSFLQVKIGTPAARQGIKDLLSPGCKNKLNNSQNKIKQGNRSNKLVLKFCCLKFPIGTL